jgi:hypothetical protein
MGGVIIIELNEKTIKVFFVLFMHSFNQLFRTNLLGTGTYHDWGAVCIIGAKVEALIARDFLKADPDIGLNIFNEVAYMYRAIGIGQGRGYNDFTRHKFSFLSCRLLRFR